MVKASSPAHQTDALAEEVRKIREILDKKDKTPTWLKVLLIVILVVGGIILYNFYNIFNNYWNIQDNIFSPSPIKVGHVAIKLACVSDNTKFIMEDSDLGCNVSVISNSRPIDWASIEIQVFDKTNTTKAIFRCTAQIRSVTNSSYSPSALCENLYYRNIFKPEVSGEFVFKIFNIDYYSSTPQGDISPSIFPGDEGFYKKSLKVITKDEERNIKNTYKNLALSILMLGVAMFSTIASLIASLVTNLWK